MQLLFLVMRSCGCLFTVWACGLRSKFSRLATARVGRTTTCRRRKRRGEGFIRIPHNHCYVWNGEAWHRDPRRRPRPQVTLCA